MAVQIWKIQTGAHKWGLSLRSRRPATGVSWALRARVSGECPRMCPRKRGCLTECPTGCPRRSVQKRVPRVSRSVWDTFLTLRGHSWDTFWTLRSPSGPGGHSIRHPRFRGHSGRHSPRHSSLKGPRDPCSWSAGSQA